MSISTASVNTSTLKRYRYVAVGSETSVSGADANGNILSYTPGIEQVFLNGVLLVRNSDYTASTGTSITALVALAANDIVEIVTFSAFTVASALGAAQDSEPTSPVEGQIWLDTNGTMADTGNIAVTTIDAKGDLLVGTANDTVSRLGVGADGYSLIADSSQTSGLAWSPAAKFVSTSISSNVSIYPWNNYFVNTAAARTLTVQATPSLGDEIHVFDATGSAATNNITIASNGTKINGTIQDLNINVAYAAIVLVYTGSTYGWRVS
jgi:hypothetical protein